MKRLLPILAILLLAIPVFADSDIATIGMTGGYSTKDNTALFGFNGGYSYYASVNSMLGIGGGAHGDFSFGLNHDTFTFSGGFLAGLGLEIRATESSSVNITIGPALAMNSGTETASVGIGVGVDASYSYFFGDSRLVGVTAGVTAYPQFLVFDDSDARSFSMDAYGYIALSFRFPASLAALPVIHYILD